MSTLTVSNVSDGSLTIPTTYVTNGSAKAWVNFNGTGTIAARDSLNVSSLTDNGTGDYTVNFTNAFAAADYSTTGGLSGNSSAYSNALQVHTGLTAGSVAPTVSASSFDLLTINAAFTLTDFVYVGTQSSGDLA